MTVTDTQDEQADGEPQLGAGAPGLVLVYSRDPMLVRFPLVDGEVVLGRERISEIAVDDPLISRRHARIAFSAGRWRVRDLGSRNGTAVNGSKITGEWSGDTPPVVRIGHSILLAVADLRPFEGGMKSSRELVLGPRSAENWNEIRQAAEHGTSLHVQGETGTGKELAARAFHMVGKRAEGPFVAVNCATIPEGIAERLLFGARRGAYSGAVENADGFLKTAHGGTLFLDEIAELDAAVQSKLLRFLESGEVIPLGASRPVRVEVALCTATHKNLRDEVAQGRFRDDLYYRLAQPQVRLPPLRERLEEIPWLITERINAKRSECRAAASFVEACLLRHWPGNVRELLLEVDAAGARALRASGGRIDGKHLSPTAGRELIISVPAKVGDGGGGGGSSRSEIERALKDAHGNVAAAARALGMHRTQLRRLIKRYGIPVSPVAAND